MREDSLLLQRHPRRQKSNQQQLFGVCSSFIGLLCAMLLGYYIGLSQSTSEPSSKHPQTSRRIKEENTSMFTLEEVEEKENENEINESEEVTNLTELQTVVSIALLLIALTVGFEAMKEWLEHTVASTCEDMEITLEKLFGEMTVLGFLAIITYVFTQTGLFTQISIRVFGNGEELLEYFEYVHFAIFFIMVFFVFQVVVLIREANKTEKEWEELEETCRRDEKNRVMLEPEETQHKNCGWLPWLRNHNTSKSQEERNLYRELRHEFIIERSVDPPFDPLPEEKRVDGDFDFAKYLSLAQANTLTHAVELQRITWVFFAFMTITFYGLAVSVEERMDILSWVWVGIAWVDFLGNIAFERHLSRLRERFVASRALPPRTGDEANDDTAVRLENEMSQLVTRPIGEDLPKWCRVDVARYMERERPWLARLLVGGTPNRQQVFFWMDRYGPSLYLFVLQSNLIFIGVYAGLLLMTFLPYAYHEFHTSVFLTFLALAVLPVAGIALNKRRLVAALSIVCSIGAYRKPQIVTDVLRKEKTTQVVRTFIVIHKIRHTAQTAHGPHPSRRRSRLKHANSFNRLEELRVGKTFDAIDMDRSGTICQDELRSLLKRLGIELTEAELGRIIADLDSDGDGHVSREEFLHWYAELSEDDVMTLKDRAKDIFRMFDQNNSGAITIGEFKSKVDAFEMGFTLDEIGALVNELDQDRNESVSLEEFEHLLEKYYPEELSTTKHSKRFPSKASLR